MKRLLLQASSVGLAVMTPAVAGAYSRRLCKKTAFPFFRGSSTRNHNWLTRSRLIVLRDAMLRVTKDEAARSIAPRSNGVSLLKRRRWRL